MTVELLVPEGWQAPGLRELADQKRKPSCLQQWQLINDYPPSNMLHNRQHKLWKFCDNQLQQQQQQ